MNVSMIPSLTAGRRRAVAIAAVLAAGLAALALRVVHEGRVALRDGDDWMLRGKPAEAIWSYEVAARWYLPLAPHVGDAYDRLLALTANPDADPEHALAAWRAIRSAALATRSLWTPHAQDLEAADVAIAGFSARDLHAGHGAGDTTAAREAWYFARLEPGGPDTTATALAVVGILAWVGGALALARRGIDDAGALNRRPAVISGVAIAVGLVCWAVGLYNA